mmetsp:Transcript_38833/g.100385  ORF Transcript_38833/g.100385 Transcript_38833/m.100385 type:complete len:569 (+) Transcript_38833:147-1853(+)
MGDDTPWFLFMQPDEPRLPATNEGMVESLRSLGTLSRKECIEAFKAVDRRHFWPAGGGELAYADMPLRSGRLHLSAPHIYAKALESLMPLDKGLSFLNVGSGTGYFNSVVSELIGPAATNHGVEIWDETVAHARHCCSALGKRSMEFTVGNVYNLDVLLTTRYDRIYLGACANSRSKYLYRLLEVGGILIGPFQVGNHSQQLRRVVRVSETQFNVEVLGSVQFASLAEPRAPPMPMPSPPPTTEATVPTFAPPPRGAATPSGRGTASHSSGTTTPGGVTDDGAQAIGLAGVPFTFALSEKPWTEDRCWLYPLAYRRTVAMALLSRPCDASVPCLPTEIWVKHVFPWCPKWWFDAGYRNQIQVPGCESVQSPVAMSTTPVALLRRKATVEAILGASGDGMDVCDPDSDHSDDGDGSTRASSAGGGRSQEATPQTGPSAAPADIEAEDESSSRASLDLGDALYELFPDGRRHALGAEGDPDDETQPQVPIRVLQMIAADAQRRRRRRRWHDLDPGDEEEDDDDEEQEDRGEEEEEAEMEELEGAESASDNDHEMMDVEEVETDEEDMPAL